MHHQDKDALEKSLHNLPPGATTWGRILIRMLATVASSITAPATEVDIVLGDEGLPLAEDGISQHWSPT